MDFKFGLLGFVAVTFLFAAGNADKNIIDPSDHLWLRNQARSEVMVAINNFTGRLVEAAFGKTKDSYTMCPIIIWSMLTRISDLSEGKTKKDLQQFLDWQNESRHRLGLASLYHRYHHFSNIDINSTNMIVIDKSVKLTNTRSDHLREVNIVNVDFSKTKEAYDIIDKRAKQDTDNLINNIISKGQLKQNFKMILTNGGHLRGIWEIPFVSEKTKKPFYRLDGTKKNVKMMRAQGIFSIGYLNPGYKGKIIKIDYLWENYNLAVNNYLIMPDERASFYEIQNLLHKFDFRNFQINEKVHLDITMPQFKLETSTQLKKSLQDIGVTNIWSKESDLSGLSKNIFVDEFFQKNHITVDPFTNKQTKFYTPPPGNYTKVLVNKPFFWITVTNNGVVVVFTRITSPSYK